MPGVLFDKDSAKRIAHVVRTVERTPTGLLRIRRNRQATPASTVGIYNMDAQTIPAYGLVWLGAWRANNGDMQGKRCEYGGVTEVAIAAGPIPVGAVGTGWRLGVHPVIVTGYAAISTKVRLGVTPASWYARVNPIGPMMVVGHVPAIDQPAGLPAGTGLIMVRFDRFRPECL
ncbi:MAG TPA: hypothetical protein VMY35_00355 [Phycisphaerae bacterium]|nr:hypothetical protein [Phycisphaerae bacterium]